MRSIVRLDKEVSGVFWDVEDVGDSTLLAELNNLQSSRGDTIPVEPR